MHRGIAEPVDLLLGSAIGLWVLGQVRPREVGVVFTFDSAIAMRAGRLGLTITSAPAHLQSGRRALSVHFPKVLAPADLSYYEAVYNLHPGLLPFGRGMYPVFWALLENEPAGATLHRMTARVDAGPVIDQVAVRVNPDDTGGSLHQRVLKAEMSLFRRWWPVLTRGGELPEREQAGRGSYHDLRGFEEMRDRPPDDVDRARLIKALTHPQFSLPAWARDEPLARAGDSEPAGAEKGWASSGLLDPRRK